VVPADPDRPRTGPQPATPRSGLAAMGFPAPRQAPGERPAPPLPPPPRFAAARNGYDRAQVDRQVADLTARLGAVDEQRLDVSRRLAAERRRADRVEQELRDARAALQVAQNSAPGSGPDGERGTGFGFRAERILRMAEAEARDMRGTAAAESAALLERSHAEAEAHRHQVEQQLIARTAGLDQEIARRTGELDEREAALAAEQEATRADAERLREQARREAADLRREAAAEIERSRVEAERDATRRREQADAELDRITAVQDGMREELARLHRVLTTALPAGSGEDPAEDRAEPTGDPVPASR
jgi:cell division septum initiation protein DivIVA